MKQVRMFFVERGFIFFIVFLLILIPSMLYGLREILNIQRKSVEVVTLPPLQPIVTTAPNLAASLVAITPNPTLKSRADLNSDGLVNVLDLSKLLSLWNSADLAGDVNEDGTVNIVDISILLSHLKVESKK